MKLSLRMRLCALLTTFCLSVPTLAQGPAFIGVPGSPTVPRGEHPQIRMESERVILTLRDDDSYSAENNCVLVNDSDQKVELEIGFPESNSGEGAEAFENLKKSGFKKFSATINGKAVETPRGLVEPLEDYQEFWPLTRVTFAPRERKTVRVATLSPLGGDAAGAFNRTLSYSFTGAHWKGNVARSDLEVRVPLQGNWVASGVEYPPYKGGGIDVWTPKPDKDGAVGVLRRSWRDWNEATRVQIGLRRVMPGWLVEPQGNNMLFEQRQLDQASSFRVGAPAANFAGDAPAFVRNGVTMVAFDYLAARASDLLPDGANLKTWDAAKKRATLRRGAHTVALRVGSKTMMVDNTKPVKLREAPQMLQGSNGQTLYVPLAPATQALGLKVKVYGAEHQFYLER